MIIGDPCTFAIESGITRAYERLSFRALGFFVIHIGGRSFGVRQPDATMLACSVDEIERRLARQGSHTASFSVERGGEIAEAVHAAIYASEEKGKKSFGMSQSELTEYIYAKHLLWAPDGDEAFDDGSLVLHFDAGDRVRLIGFGAGDGNRHDPARLTDVWIEAATFYRVLERWRAAFLCEWQAAQKVPESDDQAMPIQSTTAQRASRVADC